MIIPPGETRRSFLKKSAAATALLAAADYAMLAAGSPKEDGGSDKPDSSNVMPWYRRALRWGETTLNELDPRQYDIAWWRQHWKRTLTQGIVINAGGVVAFYPSKFPLQYRAVALGDRDLFGELTRAAHEDGLVVLATVSSNRVHEDFFKVHPDWMSRDANGEPYRKTGLYLTCVNSPYYDEYIPAILREIIARSHPEGFSDNYWSGMDRDSICYCENCQRKFRELSGQPIPRAKNWDDPVYRQWIQWNYARRLEIWDSNNRTTREAGGPDCLWVGMIGATLSDQAKGFKDYKAICERSEFVMLDHQARNLLEFKSIINNYASVAALDNQARNEAKGFQRNGDSVKLLHGLLGWDKTIIETTAMFQMGRPTFRLASEPEPEVRLWMLDGIAGGAQPWWHHMGGHQEDCRMLDTARPIYRWHAENQQYLINRRPIATVGLVWSQQNIDFFGRDDAEELTELPWYGWTNALVRARIPYLPIHADHIARDGDQFSVLILPNLAAMTDAQVQSVRRFVERGGGLIATGDSSRCNEWGEPQSDFALADLFGARVTGAQTEFVRRRSSEWLHTYLRLTPETGSRTDGPKTGKEPVAAGERHPALNGFDQTDILAFGGTLERLRLASGATVLATFIPEFPVYPPEDVWMREPRTDIPGLIVNEAAGSGRVAFLPAPLDSLFFLANLPDHGTLLANLVRWTARGDIPLEVAGAGFVDCHLYQQRNKLVLHVVNLTNSGTWRAPTDELIRIGPLRMGVKLPDGVHGGDIQLLVSKLRAKATLKDGWTRFELPTIQDHEVVVVG